MKAIISGVSGQDGYFLAELLLWKGYEVHGIVRRKANVDLGHVKAFEDQVTFHYADVTDDKAINQIVSEVKPDELYHLAAQSFVPYSFTNPVYTFQVNVFGTLNFLNAVKEYSPRTRMFNAATSEMFGLYSGTDGINEETPTSPVSPYGVSKGAAFNLCRIYRAAYNLHVSSAMSFNHESEVRGGEFLTRKVVKRAVNMMKNRSSPPMFLGNLEARRDWGYAGDYVQAYHLMLQQGNPDDYVIATGEQHSVREFVDEVFSYLGEPIHWDANDTGRNNDGRVLVETADYYKRPIDVNNLKGNPAKIRERLGWEPTMKFKDIVKLMVDAEMDQPAD